MGRGTNSIIGLFLFTGLWANAGAAAQEVSLDPGKALTQYIHQAWKTDDGLPQNTVQALTQTRDGYLWLGTEEGLARFDGVRFTVFDKTNTPAFEAGHGIRVLFEDRAGVLWIGTTGSGLVAFSDGQFTPHPDVTGAAVGAIYEDRAGTLWVGTWDAGLFALHDGQVIAYTTQDGLASAFISALYEDRAGTLWIGTRDGLHQLDDGEIHPFENHDGLSGRFVTALYEDGQENLWIGTREGLDRLKDGILSPFSTEAPWTGGGVRAFWEDDAGSLWIGLDQGGLGRRSTGRLDTFTMDDGLTSNRVLAISEDSEGSLWIGTERGGLNRLREGKFTTYTTREGLSQNMAFAVYEDAGGAVWIGTEGGGLNRLADGTITAFTTRDGLSSDVVMSIEGDGSGALWVGTLGGGLNRLQDGVFTAYTTKDGFLSDAVFALQEASDGSLWIGTDAGLAHRHADGFTSYTAADGLGSDFVTALHEDRQGALWIGTYDAGLSRLHNGRFTHLTAEDGLAGNTVLALHEDADGTLWIGTYGSGLSRLKDGRLTTYTARDGLFDDTMYRILEDAEGHLWMSSNKGIFRVDRAALNAFAVGEIDHVTSTAYGKADGLKSAELNGGFQPAGWQGRDGRLWFPTVEGVAVIDPAAIRQNAVPPPVVVEAVGADQETHGPAASFELAPGTEKIEFQYTALSFIAPERISFRYLLDGYNEAWQEAGPSRVATYTNLDPGIYTFRVMARNSDGVWNETGASVSVYLRPFFYQTTWFLVICVVGALLLAAAGYTGRIRQLKARERQLERLVDDRTRDLRRAKEHVEQEKEKTEQAKTVIEAQADKLRELDRFKTRFFANVSHEFRTPLTMIVGPLENALAGAYGALGGPLKRQAEIMLRNALRLMRLINQLLDLSKLEAGKMRLQAGARNLVAFLDGLLQTMTPLAEQKGLTLRFETSAPEIELYFEPDKFEKVFYNLLSNASKFTPRGGTITMAVRALAPDDEAPEGRVEVRVEDTGKGIPKDQLPVIFDRFHQVDGSNTREHEGTGIGLALVKEMVDLHGGQVSVESEVGVGTAFIIVLKKGNAHLAENDVVAGADLMAEALEPDLDAMPKLITSDFDDEAQEIAPTPEDASVSEEASLVLVVDDNKDVREYVGSILGQHYRVATAQDGQDGLDQAALLAPDLIISDVMMPRMDGNALCRAIKTNDHLKHIPVILLTARATHASKIMGLEGGADDYMAKPFNARELLARVHNLLIIRQQQKELHLLNDELQETNRTLRQVSEVKTQVLRMAAHDLKNPLFVIREFAEIVQEEVGDRPEVSYWLQSIHTSSERMLDMTTQLLDSAALESGMIRLNAAPMRLDELVEEVVEMNRLRAEAKGQALQVTAAPADDCRIEADRERLREMLDNLVSNAIKFSPPDKTIWVTLQRAGDEVHCAVRDEGPGLTDADKQKVFGKFQRLSAVPTGEESSTGLGLSIVKQMVELHGGRVWVESEAGQGATFILALKTTLAETPKAALPDALSEAKAYAEPPRHQPSPTPEALARVHPEDTPLVLVVEDHDLARKHVHDILQEHYRVALAANGWEGLEKTRALQPDLVISDVSMPVMDGRTLCKEVKQDAAVKHIPVILMTAWATREAKTEGLAAGADDFIAKPFNAYELLARARNLITLKQREKEVETLSHQLQALREERESGVQGTAQAAAASRQPKARSAGSIGSRGVV